MDGCRSTENRTSVENFSKKSWKFSRITLKKEQAKISEKCPGIPENEMIFFSTHEILGNSSEQIIVLLAFDSRKPDIR